MKSLNFLALCAFALSANLFANDTISPSQPHANLKWEDFKFACTHPGHFGMQIPQSNIKVTCRGEKLVWKKRKGVILLQDLFKLEGEATSDKYDVDTEAFQKNPKPRKEECTRFEQVKITFENTEKKVTCSQIQGFAGDLGDFCVKLLTECEEQEQQQQQQAQSQVQVKRALAPTAKASALTTIKEESLGISMPNSCLAE